MENAANIFEYEKAAYYRDQIALLRQVTRVSKTWSAMVEILIF